MGGPLKMSIYLNRRSRLVGGPPKRSVTLLCTFGKLKDAFIFMGKVRSSEMRSWQVITK